MGNTLSNAVNFSEYKAYTCINENDILSDTQARLKESDDKLLLEITKISARCDHNSTESTTPICKAIREHKKNEWVSFSSIEDEENMEKYIYEKKFVNLIKSNEDFIRAYILEEEKNTIWVVINDFAFKYKKIYLQEAREFKEKNDCEFDMFIFDKKQLDNIDKQLNFMGEYEIIDNGR